MSISLHLNNQWWVLTVLKVCSCWNISGLSQKFWIHQNICIFLKQSQKILQITWSEGEQLATMNSGHPANLFTDKQLTSLCLPMSSLLIVRPLNLNYHLIPWALFQCNSFNSIEISCFPEILCFPLFLVKKNRFF